MRFDEFIKSELQTRKVSFRQFEKSSGISRGLLSRWINGHSMPQMKNILKLSKWLSNNDIENKDLSSDEIKGLQAGYMNLIINSVVSYEL